MPKRKAPTKLSGLTGSDDEDIMQVTGDGSAPAQESHDEPPAKKRRGRPRISNDNATESQPTSQAKKRESATAAQADAPPAKKPGRRGRPRGSSRTSEAPETQMEAEVMHEAADEKNSEQENEDPMATKQTKITRATRATKPAPTRRTGRAASAAKHSVTDGEFEYTPSGSKQAVAQESREEPEASPRPRAVQRRQKEAKTADPVQNDEPAREVVDESILPDEVPPARHVPSSAVKNARSRLSTMRNTLEPSPRKRNSGDVEQGGEPELRRKIGDLTKKQEALESKYRNLREIGVVEANTNMEKLRKQCETVTTASNELVASLRSELEAQRALGQQSRALQKQLKERDAEIARLQSQADESRSQIAASQTEVKALQTKLAAARNTAASLEKTKIPGSAIKGGPANRAVAAANAGAAQAAQVAQLKEDLYSDLTGLIVRGVTDREADHLYDCIQTGVNGTLHFKLAIPKVPSSEYEKAVFEYLPLLDANRDRDLVDILPDFLIDHITFEREQAPKFYTRVIDALTKRRSSTASRV
ncbi:Chromosome segregation protein (Pcs1) [Penicillium longicatenatum]|uniref:Chromosome segregation protein (Pcs1) n=1 Tax=Penicillium longicatenatum TaxID=1561947 RepID=UPI0025478F2E|nr:Chromosome segregation protein (Pcs1) [Penicillium longicatenatum]KAJ5631569.1 Chromosome segregation protein (Pcs1) [Penicillium longicatenatum]